MKTEDGLMRGDIREAIIAGVTAAAVTLGIWHAITSNILVDQADPVRIGIVDRVIIKGGEETRAVYAKHDGSGMVRRVGRVVRSGPEGSWQADADLAKQLTGPIDPQAGKGTEDLGGLEKSVEGLFDGEQILGRYNDTVRMLAAFLGGLGGLVAGSLCWWMIGRWRPAEELAENEAH